MYARRRYRRIGVLDGGDCSLIDRFVGIAIERAQQPILAGRGQNAGVASLNLGANERTGMRNIPVMRIIGNELLVPQELSGVNVKDDDAICIEIVSRANVALVGS
jgi:hypothetical protein